MLEEAAKNPLLATIALGVAGLLIRELWQLLSRKTAREQQMHDAWHSKMDKDIVTILTTLSNVVARQDNVGKELGKLESEQHHLEEKMDGLQKFWRGEFDKLREEWRGEFRALSTTLHDDLTAHRQIVHDRLDRATSAMAQQTSEFLTHLEEILQKREGG